MVFEEGLDHVLRWTVPPQNIADPKLKDLAVQYIIVTEKIGQIINLNPEIDL